MLARGLKRGQRRSWALVITVLVITLIAHAARGGTIVSLLIAAALLLLLIAQRRNFSATSDRSSLISALPTLGLVALSTAVVATIGIEGTLHLGHHHLPAIGVVFMACLERLAGQSDIALPDRVVDFINPALLAVGVSLVTATLYLLTRPVVDRRLSTPVHAAELRLAELRARDIVHRHGQGTLDYFALHGTKKFFFYRDSLVAYAIFGGVALVSPDPIGPPEERTEVFSAFCHFAEHRGWAVGVMGASAGSLNMYEMAGMRSLYIGDEAIVDCQKFTLDGRKMKGLRQACTRLSSHGYTVEFLDPAHVDPSKVTAIVELTEMLRRGENERGFSMTLGRLFDPKDKGLLLTVVYDPGGHPAAVCQFVPAASINGYSLDIMRRDPSQHPNGLLDYTLCSTIKYLRSRGHGGLSLNFAAFRSVLEGDPGESALTKIQRWGLKRFSGVLPIETLWLFNAKYQPTWVPRYLVYQSPENFVPVAMAVMRAENFSEIPVIGRFLTVDPTTCATVPKEVLESARKADESKSQKN
jgi:lysyl-tRNA synthetase class 2